MSSAVAPAQPSVSQSSGNVTVRRTATAARTRSTVVGGRGLAWSAHDVS